MKRSISPVIKRSFRFGILLSFLVFLFSFNLVRGQETGRPFLDLRMENISVADGVISGQIVAKNNSGNPVNNVSFSHTLWEGLKTEKRFIDGATRDVFVDRSVILAGKKDDAIFSLLPGEERATSFTLPYSSHLESGEYRLLARVVGIATDSILGEIARNVNLEGDNQFLKINYDTCRVIREDKEYFVKAGPNFYPGEKPKVSCEITNPTNKDISATAQFDVAVFSVFDSLQYSPLKTKGDPVNFPANSTKKITLEINSPQEPQVYEAGLRFIDDSGKSFSPYAFFRWIITGPSARIDGISSDKSFYRDGEEAKVSVEFFGSMDLFWRDLAQKSERAADQEQNSGDFLKSLTTGVPEELLRGSSLKNTTVVLKIRDVRGRLCGESNHALTGSIDNSGKLTQEFVVPIRRTCADPKFTASVYDAGQNLANLDYQVRSSPQEKMAAVSKRSTYLLYIVAALLILLALFLYRLKQSSSRLSIYLGFIGILIILSFLLTKGISLADSAQDQYISVPWGQNRAIGPDGMGYLATISGAGEHGIWFTHHHNPVQSYWNPGTPVQFSFYAQANSQAIWGCGNYLWETQFNQFLTRVDVYLNGGLAQSYFYETQMPDGASPPVSMNSTHNFGVLPPGNYQIKTIAKNIARIGVQNIPYDRTEGLDAYAPPYTLTSYHSGETCFVPGPCNNTDQNYSWANSMQVIRYSDFTIGVPTLSFSANPGTITLGQSSTLNWSSQNTTSCSASGAWSGGKATGGSEGVSPSNTSIYTLTCSGPGGSISRSATVNVNIPTPSLSFSANPSSINTGQSSTLSWSSQNTTSCSASGAWSGGKATGGSEGVSPSNTSTYTLSCSGPGGSISQSATVTVLNRPPSASIGCTSPSPNCTGYTPLDPVTLLNQSGDPDNNITSCAWSITGPQTQSLNACSNFTPQSLQPGNYNAQLTVTDAYSLSSTANKAFSMKQDVIAKFSCSEDNATYTENCSSLDPTINSQFFLKDLSTPSQGATVNSWSWSMTNSNPSSSSLQNVIARFITQGAQTVTLRATDTQGRTDTEQKTVNTRSFLPKFREVAP